MSGITGSGVIVAVLDEGLELAHEDLVDNIVSGSYDFENSDQDPTRSSNEGDHGTSVAGIIASKGWNNKGGRGVAPNASLIGYNYLDVTTLYYSQIAQMFGSNPPVSVDVDIHNLSLGRDSYGVDEDKNQNPTYTLTTFMNSIEEDALKNGVANLRGGKGASYVKSAGNHFRTQSTSDCGTNMTCTELAVDDSHGVPYMIVVAALDADNIKSSYSSTGAGLWISGFGGENGGNQSVVGGQGYSLNNGIYKPAIMTTDQSTCASGYVSDAYVTKNTIYYNEFQNPSGHSENTNCNYHSIFNGTSSAAPTISGVIALMLEANPDLTWRDVKHILATTADKIDASRSHTYQGLSMYEWKENAAGYEFHPWYGFGKIDAAEAVTTASSYTANSLGSWVTTGYQTNGIINAAIDHTDYTLNTIAVTKPSGSNGKVEYVRVSVQFDHAIPNSIGIRLLSPDSTVLNIFQPITNLGTNPSSILFDIGVSGLYGENIEGNWSIAVDDYKNDSTDGNLIKWGIEVYGN